MEVRVKVSTLSPWYWRSLPLEHRTGSDIFAQLFLPPLSNSAISNSAIATLLESPAPYALPQSRYSICAGTPRRHRGSLALWTPKLGTVLPCLRQLLPQQPWDNAPPELPFSGGWLGWLGYDVGWEIERLPWLRQDTLPFPLAYWYEPEAFAVLDHQQQILWLAASSPHQLTELEIALEQPPVVRPYVDPGRGIHSLHFCTDQSDYEAAIARAKQYIQSGDIFQANLSLRFQAQGTCDSWLLYRALQQINPSPFASYWSTPWGAVVSSSPERLVHFQGQRAQTRPIAGTRPRGSTPTADQRLATELLTNAKENAEHTMLVDLERNDLGRVCQWGSVVVDEFLVLESYSHVMHLVSNIVGTLQPKADAIDLIRALFPGGTITGCPKVRCMEIIEELEPLRRNLFYGSCGYLDQRGHLDLNILIRTLLVTPWLSSTAMADQRDRGDSLIWGQVGAGIVADSIPEREWQEALQKAQAQLAALGQTMASPAAINLSSQRTIATV